MKLVRLKPQTPNTIHTTINTTTTNNLLLRPAEDGALAESPLPASGYATGEVNHPDSGCIGQDALEGLTIHTHIHTYTKEHNTPEPT